MKRAFLVGLVVLVGTGLLLSGCSGNNGANSGQPQVQPTQASIQPQVQPTQTSGQAQAQPTPIPSKALVQPTPTGASIDQSAAEADQALNNMQSTLQAIDVSTPSSTGDQSLNDVDQSLNSLQQTVQNEPTP